MFWYSGVFLMEYIVCFSTPMQKNKIWKNARKSLQSGWKFDKTVEQNPFDPLLQIFVKNEKCPEVLDIFSAAVFCRQKLFVTLKPNHSALWFTS